MRREPGCSNTEEQQRRQGQWVELVLEEEKLRSVSLVIEDSDRG